MEIFFDSFEDFVKIIIPRWAQTSKPYYMRYKLGVNSSYAHCLDENYSECKLIANKSIDGQLTTLGRFDDVSKGKFTN